MASHPVFLAVLAESDASLFLQSLSGGLDVRPVFEFFEPLQVVERHERRHALAAPFQDEALAGISDTVQRVCQVVADFRDTDVHGRAPVMYIMVDTYIIVMMVIGCQAAKYAGCIPVSAPSAVSWAKRAAFQRRQA